MKYKVTHSFLTSFKGDKPQHFVRDQHVTEEELKAAGFEKDHLLANDAIEPLEGTAVDPAVVETKPVIKADKK